MTLNKGTVLLLAIFFLTINFSYGQEKFEQYGYASYYADAFQGRNTTSGEKYNNTLYTAAHATLPFHTLVKITNLKNNISVVVKINDRCPKYGTRIIDLSKAAAKKLDIIAAGIAHIKLEVISLSQLNIINNYPDSLGELFNSDSSSLKSMFSFSRAHMTRIERQLFRNLVVSKILISNFQRQWKEKRSFMAMNYLYFLRYQDNIS
jgi:rare lipoprotein A